MFDTIHCIVFRGGTQGAERMGIGKEADNFRRFYTGLTSITGKKESPLHETTPQWCFAWLKLLPGRLRFGAVVEVYWIRDVCHPKNLRLFLSVEKRLSSGKADSFTSNASIFGQKN